MKIKPQHSGSTLRPKFLKNSATKKTKKNLKVRYLSLQNLNVIEIAEEHHEKQNRSHNDSLYVIGAVDDQEPNDHDECDEEEDHANDGIDAFQSRRNQIQKVQHQQNDIDDQCDEIETRCVPKPTLPETVTVVIRATQHRRQNETNDDLHDLEDSAVSSQISSVYGGHFANPSVWN